MYAVLFEIDSWLGPQQYVFEGESAYDMLWELEQIQDLDCLARMGKSRERSAEGKKSIKILEAFLEKRRSGNLTVEDLLMLDIHLKLGDLKCITVVEGEEAIAQLKASIA